MDLAAMDRLGVAYEVKAVDVVQRVIEGYASITGNEDDNGDIVEPGAMKRTVAEHAKTQLKNIDAYIGHDRSRLPVGLPMEVREDARGLYTKTRIHTSSDGDDLLAVARERMEAGKPMGMSIGYIARDFTWEGGASGKRATGSMKRRIKDLDLGEYSFTAIPANGKAVVLSVKSAEELAAVTRAAGRTIELKHLAAFDPAMIAGVASVERLSVACDALLDAVVAGTADETKAGNRMRADMRRVLAEINERIAALTKWAEYDDDAAAAAAADAGTKARLTLGLLEMEAAVTIARASAINTRPTSGGVN